MNMTRGILVSTFSAALIGFSLLLPQPSSGQAAGMPAGPAAALRSGWQLLHFSVGYAVPAQVSSDYQGAISTRFGSDEVHYFLLRKEGAYIVCYQRLAMSPGAGRYVPWKRE